jgi:ubiquitin-protein ligase
MTLLERLNIENQILNRDGMSQYLVKSYPQGNFYYIYGDYNSSSGRSYTIWCRLPEYYPNECPKVYVYKPNPLIGYGGVLINSYGNGGTSHQMHTLEKGSNGEVQICHWRQNRWHSGVTLNKVMIKAMLWLEAYEQHLSTGKSINDFVSTMREA